MTEQECKEAAKSFRCSVIFWKWCFILYGNWKRRIVRLGGNKFRFEIVEWHPFRAVLNWDERQKLKQ